MSPEHWDRCKRIFSAALDASPEDRSALVNRECGEDAEMRSRVLTMLDAAVDESSPVDVCAGEQLVGLQALAEPLMIGDVVGRFRILRLIGQGGTSLVYLAEQSDFRSPRRFAVKIIASAFIAGRPEYFERECEILAAFEHPNIVRIIDRGVTPSGWPYLVMDYIDGSPFHKYCHEHRLAPPEIVRLFLDGCQAIKYMHKKLIVHCDLKPTNILVDPAGSPWILDFGISRILEPSHATRSGQTTRGVRPFTPDYASPEQLDGGPLTFSTDIYSLGVVLYESLTGALPFDHAVYSYGQDLKKPVSKDPAPPSKVRAGSASPGDDGFTRQLRGDLDSIVLKALAHHVAERYTSIDEFIADLQRYLAGDAILARRSTFSAHMGKYFRRHARLLAEVAAAVLLIGLAVGLSIAHTRRQMRDCDAEDLTAAIRPIVQELVQDSPDSGFTRRHVANRLIAIMENISARPRQVPDFSGPFLQSDGTAANPYLEPRTCYSSAPGVFGHTSDAGYIAHRGRSVHLDANCYLHSLATTSNPRFRGKSSPLDRAWAGSGYESWLFDFTPCTCGKLFATKRATDYWLCH
jgi:hypothetical protein